MSVSPSKTAKAAGHDHDPATTAAAHVLTTKNLDPQLFMAARRGDYTQLKELLKLNDGDWNEEQATAEHITGAAAAAQVVVEVDDHRRRPAAASELLDLVTMEGDSLLHVVAACGDDEKFLRCAKLLFSRYKDLLSARNSKGDTPLHCAATAGNNNMVKCLVLLARGSETLEVKKLLKMPNECGETALHHAVRARRKDVVDQLMTEDPEQLACNDLIPSSEVSPLYLAVSLGEMEIARRLFIATSMTNKGKPSTYSGPHGRNVLHAAAISPGPALKELLEWLKDVTAVGGEVQRHGCLIISQLTRQRDENGSTPLHLAASLGGLPLYESVSLLRGVSQRRRSGASTLTTQLLDADLCPVYQPDDKGFYPIHVAAWAGNLNVVHLMLKRCPDSSTLRDCQGRTFLHVAVERKRLWLVLAAVVQSSKLSSILNLQDNNGETALHRAVQIGDLFIFASLMCNKHVRLDVADKKGLTPLDVWWTMTPNTFHHLWNERSAIINTLTFVRAPHGETRSDLFYERLVPQRDNKGESKKLTETAQVMILVSVLIATVTFASAFTLPGGYQQSGVPVLAGTYAFDAFVLADVLAFVFSCQATALLAFAGAPTVDLANRYHTSSVSYWMLRISLESLLAAFALGFYVVLAPVGRSTAIVISVIVLAFALQLDLQSMFIFLTKGMAVIRYNDGKWDIFVDLLSLIWPYIVIFGLPPILNLIKRMAHH